MSIRYQILVPLILVILGLVAFARGRRRFGAAGAAAHREQVHGVIRTLNQIGFR